MKTSATSGEFKTLATSFPQNLKCRDYRDVSEGVNNVKGVFASTEVQAGYDGGSFAVHSF